MGYLGKQPALQASEYREEFNITSTTTNIITSGFVRTGSSNYLEVYRNGVLLGKADYTLQSDYKTIVLTNAAVAGDIVVVLGRRNLTQGLKVAERRHEHVIQNGETTVTFPFPLTADITDVYINGVKLWYGDGSGDGSNSDYAINPVTRVISFGLNPSVGDTVSIVSREPTSVSSTPLPLIDSNGASVISENGGVISLSADTAVIEGSSSGDLVRITQTGTGNALVVEDSANPDSTPFVIDASGKLLVGTSTSVTSSVSQQSLFQVYSTSSSSSSIQIGNYTNGVNAAGLHFDKSRGSLGTNTVLQSGDNIGSIKFNGADGTNLVRAASIDCTVDGTPGTNNMPGRLIFSTTADGASSPTEAMRIDSSGNVGIGTISPSKALDVKSADDTQIEIEHTGGGGGFIGVDSSNVMNIGRTGPVDLAFKTNNTERMRIDSSGNVLVGTTSTYTNTLLNVNGEINATRFHTFRYNESGTGAKTFYFYANASQGQGDFNYANYGTGHVFELAISASGAFNEAGCVWTGWTDGDQPWRTMSSYSQGQLGSFAFATGVTNGSGWVGITWNPYNANYSCVFKINIRRINSHY